MTQLNSGIFLQGAHKKAKRPRIAKEGILGRIGGGKKAVSRTQIQVLDLVGEGEIEGLVSGDFHYFGNEGEYGYVSGRFEPYESFTARAAEKDSEVTIKSIDDVRWLRSIYWNNVPLVDTSEQLNYANIDVAFVNGNAKGLGDNRNVDGTTETSFSRDVTRKATKTRAISERLRGPNYIYNSSGRPTEDFEDIYNPNATDAEGKKKHRRAVANSKAYRVLNKNCTAVKVNVKIASLQYRELRRKKKLGSIRNTTVKWMIEVEPIFSAFSEVPEAVRKSFKKTRHVEATGRVQKGYLDSREIPLENLSYREDFIGWEITIIRKTFEAVSASYANTTFVDSITEVYEDSYSYPHSAIVSSKFSAEFFSQVPDRKFDMKCLKVKVPNNYNPLLRNYGQISGGARYAGSTGLSPNINEGNLSASNSFNRNTTDDSVAGGATELTTHSVYPWVHQDVSDYYSSLPANCSGVKISGLSEQELGDKTVNGTTDMWDGNFKSEKQWTDNPAWVFYDLLTNRRYGLGEYINESDIDKWTLFKIGQYCDQLVPDGLGGLEPRFSANIVLNKREEAFKVVNDMSSIFRAVAYYGQGSIFAVQDSPKDPLMLFTNSNVEGGNFNYQSSNKKARHNVAIVKYLDREDFYRPAIEYVKDIESIKQYGEREVETTAFGAVTKSQAMRWGKWTLLTENLQTETVNFTAGLEASYLRPGDVFRVQDQNRIAESLGGRVSGIRIDDNLGAVITLDRYSLFPEFQPHNLQDDSNDGKHQFGTGTLSLMLPTHYYDPISTDIANEQDDGSSTDDDPVYGTAYANEIRNELILEFNFWTGHSLRSDADGYISRLVGPSGEHQNGLVEITLTGSNYQSKYINTSIFDLDLGDASSTNNNSKTPFVYTIHDAQNTGDTSNLYSTLSVRETDNGAYEVMGLEYASGKFDQVEQDFTLQTQNTAFSTDAPKTPHVEAFFNNPADTIEYKVKVAQVEDEDTKVESPDPNHNTNMLIAYYKYEANDNPHDILASQENYFSKTADFKNGGEFKSPAEDNNPWSDFTHSQIVTYDANITLEKIMDVSRSAGVHSFAFYSMNYFGKFSSSPVLRTIAVPAEEIDGDDKLNDIEIAALSINDEDKLELQYGSNEDVKITDLTTLGISWTINTVGEGTFLRSYGMIPGAETTTRGLNAGTRVVNPDEPLPIASHLHYLITVRDQASSFNNGLASPNANVYNFKDFSDHVGNFQSLSDTSICSNPSIFIKQAFDIDNRASNLNPVELSPRSTVITIEDLIKFKDSNNEQLNYSYEYGPPRRYDIFVELINDERTVNDGTERLVTSASTQGLGNYDNTTDIDSDSVGTNTGYDGITITNRRLPTFFFVSSYINDLYEQVADYDNSAGTYANVDLNSINAFVKNNSKIFLLKQNYTGTKDPRSSDGKDYWIEVDAICQATLTMRNNKLFIRPVGLAFFTSGSSVRLTSIPLSNGFQHERFNDFIFGGFQVVTSTHKEEKSTTLFRRDKIHELGKNVTQGSKQDIEEVIEEQTEGGEEPATTVNQEIRFLQSPFEREDDLDEGDDDVFENEDDEPDSDVEAEVTKTEAEIFLDIPTNVKHVCIAPLDRFDISVINYYRGTTSELSDYLKKAMPYSNIVDVTFTEE
tara:strand:- start:373 stop:5259 length:4887 start_codon:yes stop_codon:yes gene_type:complete